MYLVLFTDESSLHPDRTMSLCYLSSSSGFGEERTLDIWSYDNESSWLNNIKTAVDIHHTKVDGILWYVSKDNVCKAKEALEHANTGIQFEVVDVESVDQLYKDVLDSVKSVLMSGSSGTAK